MRVAVLLLVLLGLACAEPLVGEKYESKADGIRWTVSGVFSGKEATIACGKEVNTCIRLTSAEEAHAKYVSGKALGENYWYVGRG